MMLPPLLVSAYHTTLEQSALLVLDLNSGTYEILRPYPGPICATADALYLLRFLGARARLEKYNRDGLCWMRRVEHCLDPHSLIGVGDELALCSTGTNEIIFLDANGTEVRRWSPDPAAEPDSWHLNGLTCHEDRLYATCFGRFEPMRGWADHYTEAGLILEVATGATVLSGLTMPHDPWRLPGGWLVNESKKGRLLHVADDGSRDVIAAVDGFPRGLAVLPEHYVLGVSQPRQPGGPQGCADVRLIDRRTRQLLRILPLPYPEIGHVTLAPAAEVLEAMRREQTLSLPCLLPLRAVIDATDRAGSVKIAGPLVQKSASPEVYEVSVRLTNAGQAVWASENDYSVQLSYQVLNAAGGVLVADGWRTRLPLPLTPGRSVTFPVCMDLTICHHLPAAAAVRLTLLQEGVAWWEASERWSPALVPLPAQLLTPPEPPAAAWWAERWRQTTRSLTGTSR